MSIDLYLLNTIHLVLHRIFNRNNFIFDIFDGIKCAIEGCCLTASCRSCDQNNSKGHFDRFRKFAIAQGTHTCVLKLDQNFCLIQNPHNNRFTKKCRKRRNPEIEIFSRNRSTEPAILRLSLLRDIKIGEEFQP